MHQVVTPHSERASRQRTKEIRMHHLMAAEVGYTIRFDELSLYSTRAADDLIQDEGYILPTDKLVTHTCSRMA